MRMWVRLAALLTLALPAASTPQAFQAPRHVAAPPTLLFDGTPLEILVRADAGMQVERDRSPGDELGEHAKRKCRQ